MTISLDEGPIGRIAHRLRVDHTTAAHRRPASAPAPGRRGAGSRWSESHGASEQEEGRQIAGDRSGLSVGAARRRDERWPTRAKAVVLGVLPPLLTFAAARLLLWIVIDAPPGRLDAQTWARWDSGQYDSIAQHGYNLNTCASLGAPDLGTYCGNAAWHPLLPVLMRAVGVFGLSTMRAGILVSQVAFAAVLVVVWVGFLDRRVTKRNVGLLVLAGFFFGGVYYFAVFPLSLFVLLVLLWALAFSHGRWILGGVAALLAVLAYPLGVVLVPVGAVWVLLGTRGEPPGHRALVAGASSLLAASGLLVVFAVHQVTIGRWDASLEQQRTSFRAGPMNPLTNWIDVVVRRSTWTQVASSRAATVLAVQTAVVAVVVLTALVVVVRDRGRSTTDIGVALLVAALWLVPLSNDIASGLYRRESTILPVVLLLRRAPTVVVWAFAVAAVALFGPLARLFQLSLVM